jgi:hypothetical protein
MTAAGHVSKSDTGGNGFTPSQIDPCIAAVNYTRPPAHMLSLVLKSRSTPRAGSALTAGIQGTAPPAIG